MGKNYFARQGFMGLTMLSKLKTVGMFVGVAIISYIISFYIFGYLVFHVHRGKVSDGAYGVAFFVALALAILASQIYMRFLKKDTYYNIEYFCADCGNYIGTSPDSCDRCGCNRYTTEDTGVGRTYRSR